MNFREDYPHVRPGVLGPTADELLVVRVFATNEFGDHAQLCASGVSVDEAIDRALIWLDKNAGGFWAQDEWEAA